MKKVIIPILPADTNVPNCLECVHYHITWDGKFPHGCRAMNFKSKRLPQLDVLESSGQDCLAFAYRPRGRISR